MRPERTDRGRDDDGKRSADARLLRRYEWRFVTGGFLDCAVCFDSVNRIHLRDRVGPRAGPANFQSRQPSKPPTFKAAMTARTERPLSPHLQTYRWTLTMALSIVHRVTGIALYFGTLLLAWWLIAAASGPGAYSHVQAFTG